MNCTFKGKITCVILSTRLYCAIWRNRTVKGKTCVILSIGRVCGPILV
jgi:hypothetical protein